MKRGIALGTIAPGALLRAGVATFMKIARDYRHSFTSSELRCLASEELKR